MGPVTESSRGPLTRCWCLLVLLLPFTAFGETCQKVKLTVPHKINSGGLIGKVNLKQCLNSDNLIVRSNNPDFVVLDDGSVYARKSISMSTIKRSFVILLMDIETQAEKKVHVKLVTKTKTGKSRHAREAILKRTKRKWRPLPFSIIENSGGPFPNMVQQIRSDTEENYTIFYSITGSGVNQEPFNLFFIKETTGEIFVTKSVDREERSFYKLNGYAKTADGYSPELALDILIKIEDDNDNAPVFTEQAFCVEVFENTKAGVIIGRVNATDRDEPYSLHTRLRYTIISQFPRSPVMFAMHPANGIITTTTATLDRELLDIYILLIEVRDMDGQPFGLSSTGTVSITVVDINDFAPTFTALSYQTEVKENESGMVILQIPVVDKDKVNTSNWRAVYTITQGNERGFFNITTDPITNNGLLWVVKGINYEEFQRIQIIVGVTNEASLILPSGVKASGMSTVPVTVIVRDVDEGPEFQPLIKIIRVKENLTIGTDIGEYLAIDPETKSSTGIRYTKLIDTFSVVNIAESTGRITTLRILDYETKEVLHHQYNVTVLATDQSGKSGTGTIMIVMEDFNDNMPFISKSTLNVCQVGRTYSEITADDHDAVPNSAPFKFSLDTSSNPTISNQWRVVQQDGKSMHLEQVSELPIGMYDVPISVVDQQGHGKTHFLRVNKCNCPDGLNCADGTFARGAWNTSLGGWAILVMVLSALLLALLLCFLLACLCGAAAKPSGIDQFDQTQQNLIVTNSEAPGADVMDQNFLMRVTNPNVSGQAPSGSGTLGQGGRSGSQIGEGQKTIQSMRGGHQMLESMRGGHQLPDSSRYTYSEWQSFMNSQLGDKLYVCGQDEEHQHGEDYVLPYNYEGKGSLAGSVGCCSEFRGEEEKLDFLNQLEPKFRTLAEVCAKK
ncbi:hypothetical protein FKM82_006191 [Ascaphus truei]